jgi:hypothetical protein
MPMIARGLGELAKTRILISGFGNSGKTYSIQSFAEEGKSLVTLICPGETGIKSLPEDSEVFSSYYYEGGYGVDTHSVQWSIEALHAFEKVYKEIEKNSPDKLFVDGIHWWYAHNFNVITNGEHFAGVDMNINPTTGRSDPYRSARFYNQGHTSFGQRIASLYASPIPFIGVTTLEDWQAARTDSERAGGIDATRYLWPALPGAMATNVVSRFDARLSARLEKRCLHSNCEYTKDSELHYVWQFAPKNDVMGVGIKGLRVTQAMQQRPWIHQTWSALQGLLKRV